MCYRWCNTVILAPIWRKLISVSIRCSVSQGNTFRESISQIQPSVSEKSYYSQMFYFGASFVPNRSVMWRSMGASVPGPAGPCVVIMMGAAPAPVCVGHGPVTARRLSVAVSSATASVWRLPTAHGKLLHWHICKSISCFYHWSLTICKSRWRARNVDGRTLKAAN